MTCAEFDDYVSLHLSGELDAPRRVAFDAHLGGCRTCACLLERQMRADALLAASIVAPEVRVRAVQSVVRERMHTAPWWLLIFSRRVLQVALASVLMVVAAIAFSRSRPNISSDRLLSRAAADHVEDVVRRLPKEGWLADVGEAEQLSQRIVGDARAVRSLAPAGYRLVKARPCRLEGKSETAWLHLIYLQGAHEVSFFVRSSHVSPVSEGQLALTSEMSSRRFSEVETIGFQRGSYDIVLVADLSREEAQEMAVKASHWIS